MELLGPFVLGLLLIGIGTVNWTGNISTVKRHSRRNVRDEDIPAYGKAIGGGTMVIGAAVAVSPLLMQVSDTAETVVVIAGIIVGLAIILYGQIKCNGGIF